MSGAISGLVEFIRSLPLPILITIILGMTILFFIGISYMWSIRNKYKKPKAGESPTIIGKNVAYKPQGGQIADTITNINKPEEHHDKKT